MLWVFHGNGNHVVEGKQLTHPGKSLGTRNRVFVLYRDHDGQIIHPSACELAEIDVSGMGWQEPPEHHAVSHEGAPAVTGLPGLPLGRSDPTVGASPTVRPSNCRVTPLIRG
ncbi:hypothetical protein MULP_02860 [Mycobacterium liflandii 128FXT]|uniref:Uncharacterized protein n=1 Tax=Mycobacterium liflandii (strain 128FXT) TaxID=459424 RepID=L7V7S0_MYCL1|nr:hypothetical protein MULP_02860 [Mycobacterium liflandii 128FXT]